LAYSLFYKGRGVPFNHHYCNCCFYYFYCGNQITDKQRSLQERGQQKIMKRGSITHNDRSFTQKKKLKSIIKINAKSWHAKIGKNYFNSGKYW
jgi:hypothetical protein